MATTTPTRWKSPFKVNTTGASAAGHAQNAPLVTSLTGGRSLIVWLTDTDPSGLGAPDVFGQIYDAQGKPIGGEMYLNSFEDFAQTHPRVAALPDGGFVLTYQTTTNDPASGTGENIAYDRFDANGTPVFTGVHLVAETTADETKPALAAFSDGSCAIVYETNASGDGDIVGAVVDATGTTQGPLFTIRAGGGDSRSPEAATLTGGNFVVVYTQDAGGGKNIEASLRRPDGSRVLDTTVASTVHQEDDPQVVGLRGGGFVVTWTDPDGDGAGNASIMARLYSSSGSAPDPAFEVNTSKAGNQVHSTVTDLADGGFVVAWQDLGNGNIRARRFAASGAGVGGEFVAATLDSVSEPRLATLGDGRFGLAFTNTKAGDDDVYSTIWDPRTSPIIGTAGADVLTSRLEGATLRGSGGADTLFGEGGDDVIDGGKGVDTMTGGGGKDVYYVDDAGDRVIEAVGGGLDLVYSSADYTLAASQEIEQLYARAGATGLTLTGNELANALFSGAGSDTLAGAGGNDVYHVDGIGDVVDEAVGGGTDRILTTVDYALKAGQEIEVLTTSSVVGVAAIDLTGNDMAQTIQGNAGANIVDGKGGNDVLSGYGGADTFVFDTPLSGATNLDRITDFAVAADTIRLSHAIFTTLAAGPLSSDAFYAGSTAHDADDRIIYNPANAKLFYDTNGNAAGGVVQFATLTPGLALTAASFDVV